MVNRKTSDEYPLSLKRKERHGQKKLTEWTHWNGKLKNPEKPRGKRGTFAKKPMKTDCKGCDEEFEMSVNQKVSFTKHNKPVFCSWECKNEARKLPIEERVGDEGDEWYVSGTNDDGSPRMANRSRRRRGERKRSRANKITCIEYLGGSCVDCDVVYGDVDSVVKIGGVTFIPAEAFDIEHVIWQKKKIEFGSRMKSNFEKVLKPEIDNCECILLCKICHVIRTTKTKNENKEFKTKMKAIARANWKNQYSKN